jgi:hypothetical protein
MDLIDERDGADDLIARAKTYLARLQLRRDEIDETLNRELADSETAGATTLDLISLLPPELDCTVCLAEIDTRSSAVVLQTCGHVFHADCVSKLLPHRLPNSTDERRLFNRYHPEKQVDFLPDETYVYRRCPNCLSPWETPKISLRSEKTVGDDTQESPPIDDDSLPNAQLPSQET